MWSCSESPPPLWVCVGTRVFQLSPLGHRGVCIRRKPAALTCPKPRARTAQMSGTESRLWACFPDGKQSLLSSCTFIYSFFHWLIEKWKTPEWEDNLISKVAQECLYLPRWSPWRNDDNVTLGRTRLCGIVERASIRTETTITMKHTFCISCFKTIRVDAEFHGCICTISYHCDSCPPLHGMTAGPPPEAKKLQTSAWYFGIPGFLPLSCFHSCLCGDLPACWCHMQSFFSTVWRLICVKKFPLMPFKHYKKYISLYIIIHPIYISICYWGKSCEIPKVEFTL